MPRIRRLSLLALLIAAGVNFWRHPGRVEAAVFSQDADGPVLRVSIIGDPADPRVPPTHEAIAFWNREFLRLGRRIRLDSAIIRPDSVPDALLRAASSEAAFGRGPATSRLLRALEADTGDIVIALSRTDLISFSVRWREGSRGVVGLRRSDIPPLSMLNTVRNVVAHELGHVLGLDRNGDSTTLMCGRPAACRPAALSSDRATSSRCRHATTAESRGSFPDLKSIRRPRADLVGMTGPSHIPPPAPVKRVHPSGA